MKHADTTPSGWWTRKGPWYNRGTEKIDMPDTLRDPNNYVLTADELGEYVKILDDLTTTITKERARAVVTHRAMVRMFHNTYGSSEADPTVFTLAHVLEFLCTLGRAKLAALTHLNAMATARRLKRIDDVIAAVDAADG